ncbi:MAG: class I SAM-dependent methyltransferase [Brevefilum sp.]|nr:class I SAM-dependent methyltransferase [Brevefilum sp.]
MTETSKQHFQAVVDAGQSAVFSGWDFSWLEGRMVQEIPSWDYTELVKAMLVNAHSLLDMGTGGGEFLASLAPLPPDTHATESYPPNQPIAQRRLAPMGVTVHPVDEDGPLPFDNSRFDVVINRHESYNPKEVYRILKPGGRFLTQQVGELDNLELNLLLDPQKLQPLTDWGLETETAKLCETGFIISQAEKAALRTSFMDIGAVVYYLKAISWQIEGFTLEGYHRQLLMLHHWIQSHGPLITTAHRFLILAHKEASLS